MQLGLGESAYVRNETVTRQHRGLSDLPIHWKALK